MTIHRLDVTESTNLDARLGSPGDVFVAEWQRAGRGRLDHAWHAAKGENLTFSAVLACGERTPCEIATLPLVVGLAVLKALVPFVDGASLLKLKWPNDVLASGRKLAGILCERHGDNVIAGVGINVNERSFPCEIASRATSLAVLAGHSLDRDEILACVLGSIEKLHALWLDEGFAAIYGEFADVDFLKGRNVSVWQTDGDPEPAAGVCGGIAPDGSLSVGGRPVFAGEAHVEFQEKGEPNV